MAKKKFYAVARGRKVGIFKSWDECEKEVKGFRNARFKGFSTQMEAEAFIREHHSSLSEKSAALLSPPSIAGLGDPVVPPLHVSARNKTTLHNNEQPHPNKRRKTEPKMAMKPTHSNNNSIRRKISAYISFDGGSRGNPGIAGAGAEVIIRYIKVVSASQKGVKKSTTDVIEKRKKIHHRCYLGTNHTNNQAEYQGVICGIRQVIQEIKEYVRESRTSRIEDSEHDNRPVLVHVDNIVIQGDSKLIIQQLKGDYQCNSKNIKEYYKQCREHLAELRNLSNVKIDNIIYEHVYRNDNKIADGLANEAMDARRTWSTIENGSD